MSLIRRRLMLSAGLLAAAALGLNVLAYRHARAMMHFQAGGQRTGKPESLSTAERLKALLSGPVIPRPSSSHTPADLGTNCRVLRIPVTPGITLGAWYCPGPERSPLVILFHGYAGEKSGNLPEARALLELGAAVLLVDFRGSGDSSAAYTTIGFDEAKDVAAAVQYARTQLNPPRIILYGKSMGAAAVLRAVHSCGVEPDAIIVEAVFDRMLTTVKHRFEAMGVPSFPAAQLLVFWGGVQAGFNGFAHNPADYAQRVRCPTVLLHGEVDSRARVEEARRVFANMPGPKAFFSFSGLGHDGAVKQHRSQWEEAMQWGLEEAAKPRAR